MEEWVRLRTVNRPYALFPPAMWKSLLWECKQSNFARAKLDKLFLGSCVFSGWNRGGVEVEKVMRRAGGLDLLGLHRLGLRIFPNFEIVRVMECHYRTGAGSGAGGSGAPASPAHGRKQMRGGRFGRRVSSAVTFAYTAANIGRLKGILVKPSAWPEDNFMVFDGFTEAQRTGELKLCKGDMIVIQYTGIRDDARENVFFVGTKMATQALVQGREDAKYARVLQASRETGENAITQAKDKIDREIYCISFVKFAKALLRFCSMSPEELARFAVTELFRGEDLDFVLQGLHLHCSPLEERNLLSQLIRHRLQVDTADAEDADNRQRLISLMRCYPILLTPLVLVQAHLRRHTGHKQSKSERARAKSDGERLPQSLQAAWRVSFRELLNRVLLDREPDDSDGGARPSTVSTRRKESKREARNTTRKTNNHHHNIIATMNSNNDDDNNNNNNNNDEDDDGHGHSDMSKRKTKKKKKKKRKKRLSISIGFERRNNRDDDDVGAGTGMGTGVGAGAGVSAKDQPRRISILAASVATSAEMRRRTSTSAALSALVARGKRTAVALRSQTGVFGGDKGAFEGGLHHLDSEEDITANCSCCGVHRVLQRTRLCGSCDRAAQRMLTDQYGYKFSSLAMRKAAGISVEDRTLPTRAVWIEEYDEEAGRSFFFNVASGESQWDLPSNVEAADRAARAALAREKAKAKAANQKNNKGEPTNSNSNTNTNTNTKSNAKSNSSGPATHKAPARATREETSGAIVHRLGKRQRRFVARHETPDYKRPLVNHNGAAAPLSRSMLARY